MEHVYLLVYGSHWMRGSVGVYATLDDAMADVARALGAKGFSWQILQSGRTWRLVNHNIRAMQLICEIRRVAVGDPMDTDAIERLKQHCPA